MCGSVKEGGENALSFNNIIDENHLMIQKNYVIKQTNSNTLKLKRKLKEIMFLIEKESDFESKLEILKLLKKLISNCNK